MLKYDLYQKFISGMSALDKFLLLNTVVNIFKGGCVKKMRSSKCLNQNQKSKSNSLVFLDYSLNKYFSCLLVDD